MGPRRPRPVVLDAGAFIAFEKNDRKVRTLNVTSVSKITDTELVNAAARAMLDDRGELAEFLMGEARQRRERAAEKVVPIQSKRPG